MVAVATVGVATEAAVAPAVLDPWAHPDHPELRAHPALQACLEDQVSQETKVLLVIMVNLAQLVLQVLLDSPVRLVLLDL